MKKIFLVASVLGLFTAGVNAYPGGKNPKKSAAKTVVQTTAVSDTTHPKKKAMARKRHANTAKATQTKAK